MTSAEADPGRSVEPIPGRSPQGPIPGGRRGPGVSPPQVVLASRNAGKVAELRQLVAEAGLPLQVRDLGAYPGIHLPPEVGDTFLENARLKAVAVARQVGLPALADDSGLCVDALGGRPGVRSARYAGKPADDAANNAKLLEEIRGIPWDQRGAEFRCVVVLAMPDGRWTWAQGRTRGRLLTAPRGKGGFGYDSLFFSEELGMTFAEADTSAKNRVSHRGRALRALLPTLRAWLMDGIV